MNVQEPTNHYNPKIFEGIKQETLDSLGVNKEMSKGISSQVFKGFENLKSSGNLNLEHIKATKQILEGSQNTKSQSLFYRLFGGITGSKGRFEERMKKIDDFERNSKIYSEIAPLIKNLIPNNISSDGSKLKNISIDLKDNINKKYPDFSLEKKKMMYDQVMKGTIYNMLRQPNNDLMKSFHDYNLENILDSEYCKDLSIESKEFLQLQKDWLSRPVEEI